ncbi:MAG: hypothetical protein ACTHK7_14030 [Aureliella sp.]
MRVSLGWFGVLAIALALGAGCASPTYHYGLKRPDRPQPDLAEVNPITFGGEHPRLDRCERVVQYPIETLKSWFRRRDVPPPDPAEQRREAIYKAQEYLVLNELPDVQIDVREYDPAEQWQRLRANRRIHPAWKYTLGSISHLTYAWLPGRVFHYDSYNPYTNTLSINSTAPSMAVYEAAEAKIIRDRRRPGTYLAACYLPVFPLLNDVRVANDVLSYARVQQEWELEKELYPQIYSAFGRDLVAQATSVVPGTSYVPFYYKPLLLVGGRAAGNTTGHAVLKEREMERKLLGLLDAPGAPKRY